MRRAALVLLAMAGCVADYRGEARDCPVHRVPLRQETVPILYGLRAWDERREKAAREEFPFERAHVEGGCVVGPCSPRWALVRACEACRTAGRDWDRRRGHRSLRRKRLIPMILALLCLAQDLGAVPLSETPLKLLAGRLTARFPAEAVIEARRRGIMSAPEADERETRVVWTSGERKIVVMVYEQLETAGDDLPRDVREVVKGWKEGKPDAFAVAAFPLAEGAPRACSVVPAALDLETEAVFVFGLFTATRDRAVQYLGVYANPEAAKDAAGCAALARKIAGSVAAGGRDLSFAAGRRLLHEVEGRRLTVEMPEGFVTTFQKGSDFKVASVARLVPLGRPRPVLGVYLGRHPRLHRERADAPSPVVEEAGKHLEKDVTWHLWSEKETRFAEAILPLPDSREYLLHVFVSAPDVEGLKSLRQALSTMKFE